MPAANCNYENIMPKRKTKRGTKRLAAPPRPLVCVVDDDESVRESLPDLIGEFGYAARAFSSAEEFLECNNLETVRCVVLDIAMPKMSGPELQRELKRRGRDIPIVFITAHADENARSRVLKQGAIACLFKPFSDIELREALNSALKTA